MCFPNGTIVYIEHEAEGVEIGRTELGIIVVTVPESLKMIKKEVTHKAPCSSPHYIAIGS